jgi:hypothetical protein
MLSQRDGRGGSAQLLQAREKYGSVHAECVEWTRICTNNDESGVHSQQNVRHTIRSAFISA